MRMTAYLPVLIHVTGGAVWICYIATRVCARRVRRESDVIEVSNHTVIM